MTVRQLMLMLEHLPPDAQVWVSTEEQQAELRSIVGYPTRVVLTTLQLVPTDPTAKAS